MVLIGGVDPGRGGWPFQRLQQPEAGALSRFTSMTTSGALGSAAGDGAQSAPWSEAGRKRVHLGPEQAGSCGAVRSMSILVIIGWCGLSSGHHLQLDSHTCVPHVAHLTF